MSKQKPINIIDETVAFWSEVGDKCIDREEARQSVENITGFFDVLNEWDTAMQDKNDGQTHLNTLTCNALKRG